MLIYLPPEKWFYDVAPNKQNITDISLPVKPLCLEACGDTLAHSEDAITSRCEIGRMTGKHWHN